MSPAKPPTPTIAAVITPPGQGGIGIVQIVGPQAVAVASRVFRSPRATNLAAAPPNTLHYGHVLDPAALDAPIDEVIVRVGDAAASWLGEPFVEVNCHGGIAAVRATLDAVVRAGAQRARWQDMALRAFDRGSIDAVQLEACLELPQAKTALAADMLLAQWHRALSHAAQNRDMLQAVAATARLGIALCHPPKVVIAGRPNVGKSTLFNALLAEERALVHEKPGTTRDYNSALVEIRGVPLELVDTAGVRSNAQHVEAAGIELASAQIAMADVVLLLVDGSQPLTDDDRQVQTLARNRPAVKVITKADLPPACDWPAAVQVSALTGRGLAALEREVLIAAVGTDSPQCAGATIFTQRQARCIQAALAAGDDATAMRRALDDLLRSRPADAPISPRPRSR